MERTETFHCPSLSEHKKPGVHEWNVPEIKKERPAKMLKFGVRFNGGFFKIVGGRADEHSARIYLWHQCLDTWMQ